MSVERRRARYEQITDDLRAKIADGTYPLDSALPSTAQLMESYDASMTVVRAAIKELQIDGVVAGHPGKGIYVEREPAPAEPSSEYSTVMAQIEALRKSMDETFRSLDERLTQLEETAQVSHRTAPRDS